MSQAPGDNSHHTAAAFFTVVCTLIPDWLIGPAEKLLLAGVTALVTGFCYRAGTFLWERLRPR